MTNQTGRTTPMLLTTKIFRFNLTKGDNDMNFGEILPLLKSGKKAHSKIYSNTQYIALQDGSVRVFLKENNNKCGWFEGHASVLNEDWEEYKAPRVYLNYREMFQALLDGKKIATKEMSPSLKYLQLHGGDLVMNGGGTYFPVFNDNHELERPYVYEE